MKGTEIHTVLLSDVAEFIKLFLYICSCVVISSMC